jgi:DNA-binding winged helix-turn-helix (wHTH) protein
LLADVIRKHSSPTTNTNDCLAVNYGRAVMPMPLSNHEARLLRFGVFEINLAAGELRKNGARIRLQEQPFQVLTTLLQNAGQVVTRENLRATIWPADTFVDFDHSLNTAVNKIREALGDSASSPRFVETLARRGYRFIAAHLHDADRVASSFLPGWRALFIVGAVLVTGAVGIPLRFYLLSAVAFDFRKLGETFVRLFPFVLALDQLWAIAPFLLLPQIGVGLAFAATAALLYVPFSERTLVRLAYPLAS